jgi:hypothetical protein
MLEEARLRVRAQESPTVWLRRERLGGSPQPCSHLLAVWVYVTDGCNPPAGAWPLLPGAYQHERFPVGPQLACVQLKHSATRKFGQCVSVQTELTAPLRHIVRRNPVRLECRCGPLDPGCASTCGHRSVAEAFFRTAGAAVEAHASDHAGAVDTAADDEEEEEEEEPDDDDCGGDGGDEWEKRLLQLYNAEQPVFDGVRPPPLLYSLPLCFGVSRSAWSVDVSVYPCICTHPCTWH